MTLTDAELSALVAEKVCGWKCGIGSPSGRPYWTDEKGVLLQEARFATDSGLALEAAMKAMAGRELTLTEHPDAWFEAAYRHVDPDGYPGSSGWVSSCGPTVARALCIAALRAAGEEVEDDA